MTYDSKKMSAMEAQLLDALIERFRGKRPSTKERLDKLEEMIEKLNDKTHLEKIEPQLDGIVETFDEINKDEEEKKDKPKLPPPYYLGGCY